jgi:pimeloyl-ACP methyl ester carboxylesterase
VKELYPLTVDQMRSGVPSLIGGLELDDVGHWVQHEASDVVNEQLVKFLQTVTPT